MKLPTPRLFSIRETRGQLKPLGHDASVISILGLALSVRRRNYQGTGKASKAIGVFFDRARVREEKLDVVANPPEYRVSPSGPSVQVKEALSDIRGEKG